MVSTFTPAINMEVPARGDYVNSWDSPADANYNILDGVVGGVLSLTGLTGGTVTLTNTQANHQYFSLAGSLTSNLTVLFPANACGRKMILPFATLNGFNIFVRGNGGIDTVGVAFGTAFGIPHPIVVLPTRIYWDYGGSAPGAIASFAADFVPNGWIPCDGRSITTAQFDLLFDIIGYTYGGSGANFNVPDYRGYALVGSDNMGTNAGSAGRFFNFGPGGITGELTHALITAELAAHSHTVSDPGHVHGISQTPHQHGGGVAGGSGGFYPGLGGQSVGLTGLTNANVTINAAATGITVANAGSGTGHNNVQPSRTVNKYIRW